MKFLKLAYIFVAIISIFFCLYIGSAGSYEVKVPGFALSETFENIWFRVTEGVYDVPSEIVAWEAIVIDGKSYVYYGFFPAIVRAICLTFLDNSWFGKIGFLSCLIACFVITSFSFLIVFKSFKFWAFKRKFLRTLSVSVISIGIVIGGPVTGCILRPNLYEELILWGYAFSTIGIYGFILFLDDKDSNLGLFLISLSAACGLLSRATFGVPLYLLAGLAFLILIYHKKLSYKKIAILSVALSGLVFQLWYNYARFGDFLTFIPMNADDAYCQHVAKHGGLFNPHRIKDLFIYYFIPTKPEEFFSMQYPYFKSVFYALPNNQVFMDYHCHVTPMLVMVPYISFFYVGGVISFLKVVCKRKYGSAIEMLAFVAPFLFETLLILSFNACEERYKPELLPLVLVCMFICFRELRSRWFLYLVSVLCVTSIFFNYEWTVGYGRG